MSTVRTIYEFLIDQRGANKVRDTFDGVADGAGRADASVRSMVFQAGLLERAFSTAFGYATSLLSSVPAIGIQFQQLEQSLERQLGSAEEARDVFAEIRDIASGLPLQVTEITQAFSRLSTSGITPTLEEIQTLGDLAATNPQASLGQVVEAVIDAQVGEFERLKEFGIRARSEGDAVSLTFQNQTTTVERTSEAIREAIIEFGRFETVQGALADRADTLEGKISNLNDVTDSLKNNLFEIFDEPLENAMVRAIGLVENLADAMGRFAERTAAADEAIAALQGLIDPETGELSLQELQAQRIEQSDRDRQNVGFLNRIVFGTQIPGSGGRRIGGLSPITGAALRNFGPQLDSIFGTRFSLQGQQQGQEALQEFLPTLLDRGFGSFRNGEALNQQEFLQLTEQISRYAPEGQRDRLLNLLRLRQEDAQQGRFPTQSAESRRSQADEAEAAGLAEFAAASERIAQRLAELEERRLAATEQRLEAEVRSLQLQEAQLETAIEIASITQSIGETRLGIRGDILSSNAGAAAGASNERIQNLQARLGRTTSQGTRRTIQTRINIAQREAGQEQQSYLAQQQQLEDEIAQTRYEGEIRSIQNERAMLDLSLQRQESELEIFRLRETAEISAASRDDPNYDAAAATAALNQNVSQTRALIAQQSASGDRIYQGRLQDANLGFRRDQLNRQEERLQLRAANDSSFNPDPERQRIQRERQSLLSGANPVAAFEAIETSVSALSAATADLPTALQANTAIQADQVNALGGIQQNLSTMVSIVENLPEDIAASIPSPTIDPRGQ